ncbi:hypothetical protein [Halomicrobium katesii]|uniref:hypothetical protein n=1 Tax=Halomicrobium katesii TaxID=437163 RepID=UPI000476A79A|nr:hypothetical protein [Halomicrobium katesii]
MPDVIALQLGLPGTQELIIVLLIFVLFAAPVVVAAALAIGYFRRSSDDGTDERIAELEREVDELIRIIVAIYR